MCNQADHSDDVDCTEEAMRNAGLASERDCLFDCSAVHAGKEACDHHVSHDLHHSHEKVEVSGQAGKEATPPCCLDTTNASKESRDHQVGGKSHHFPETAKSGGQDNTEMTPPYSLDTTYAGKEACDHPTSGVLHHLYEKIECFGQENNSGTPCCAGIPHKGKEACDHHVSGKLHYLHKKVDPSMDSNEKTPCRLLDTMVPLCEISQTALNEAVGRIAGDIVSQPVHDLSLAKEKLDGIPMEAKPRERDTLGADEEQTEPITLHQETSSSEKCYNMPTPLGEKCYNMPTPLALRSQGNGTESIHSRSISDGFQRQVLEVLNSTEISTREDSSAKESQEVVMASFQTVDNKAKEYVNSVGCFNDHSEEPFLETSTAITQVDPQNSSNSFEMSQQDVKGEKGALSSQEPSSMIQQESLSSQEPSAVIHEATTSSSLSRASFGMDLAGFFSNAKGSKHESENEDWNNISNPIKSPPKSRAFMESPRSLRVLLFSDGKIPIPITNEEEKPRKDAKGLEFSSRLAPAAQSHVHEGHAAEHGFFDKGCENKDNTEFMSITFSGALTYQGLVAYSGPIPYSGSISHRSDSSASTRSFAFPILASDWNCSSPVKMAAPDPRYFQHRRKWHFCVCWKRPSTLFD